ncbi:hypothetical protein GCM10010123_26560 [Pilimelia anulata]|uniref:SWIM-type domain-containing protein n=1 Tax=Pilimelia anulata TaxID=53371 RepID=A0A8J3B9M0_9ACTN|nr:SWIM zinc finger family protein [Pilimelia anulata]GGJ95446.1 hypothetical protein GCM10010123_26560 [Pilimelia anulata]
MPVGPDGWFAAGKPIKVEGGIRARGRRGSLGEHWWSRRFVDLLESLCDGGRLARGRAYARQGQVRDYTVAPGLVEGLVQGSRPQPYRVAIRIDVLDDAVWTAVRDELAGRAVYRAALLAGEMPPEIVEVFDAVGAPLFPDTLAMACSCPDPGWPCKHLSAVLYLLAEAFDDDPFLVLAWRGRDRATLLSALRADAGGGSADRAIDAAGGAGAAGGGVAGGERAVGAAAEPPVDVARFYSGDVSVARLRERLTIPSSAPPELLLRALDPPPVRVRHIPLVDILRTAYRHLADDQP